MPTNRWTEIELKAVFSLYCRLPFGKMRSGNPDVIEFSILLGRTASAVAMKLSNFASFDPMLLERGVAGLKHASKNDLKLWKEYSENPELISYECSLAASEFMQNENLLPDSTEQLTEFQETDKIQQTRVRIVQSFFRKVVLSSYEYQCAICRLAQPELLVASHIVPWSIESKLRADPRNGLCLCALHDRAFDRGLIAIDEKMRVEVSSKLEDNQDCPLQTIAFDKAKGEKINLPHRFTPHESSLEYHRNEIFVG